MWKGFFFVFPFFLFLCFVSGIDWSPKTLSPRGEEMKRNKEIVLIRVLVECKPSLCLGRRRDWREAFAEGMRGMTQLDVFTYDSENICTSCETLQQVNCDDVLKRTVGMLVVIGGGWDAQFRCTPFKHQKNSLRPLYYPNRNMTVSQACLMREEDIAPLKNVQLHPWTIRVWIPIAHNHLSMWGIFEHAQIIPSTTGGEWVVLNDYNFPKFPSWEARPKILSPTYKEEDLFLYVSRVAQGKGQFEWVKSVRMAPNAYKGKKFRFFLSRPLSEKGVLPVDRPVMRNFISSIDSAVERFPPGTFQFIEQKASFAEIQGNMTSARGLVHLASFDRNPRVVYEALSYNLPVLVSVQSMPYQGFECAPPSFIHVIDGTRSSTDIAKDFQKFVDDTSNKTIAIAHLKKVARALTPSITYSCVCNALGLCDDHPDTKVFSEFSSVYKTPEMSQPGLRLPAVEGGCPIGQNLEGIQCDRSELFSCLRWVFWMKVKERKQVHNLFSQDETTKKLFGKHFAQIKREHCYDDELRNIFLSSIRSAKPSSSPLSFLGSVLKGSWVGG